MFVWPDATVRRVVLRRTSQPFTVSADRWHKQWIHYGSLAVRFLLIKTALDLVFTVKLPLLSIFLAAAGK